MDVPDGQSVLQVKILILAIDSITTVMFSRIESNRMNQLFNIRKTYTINRIFLRIERLSQRLLNLQMH